MSTDSRMDKKDVVHTHTHTHVMEYDSVIEITKCAICSNADGPGGFPGDSDGKEFA